ncbi:MAG TPA: glycosyltransferase family A protein [Candidatus Dormibacteraeota bacterium]|nr:glycosyltransferase family A protein [Candidatus Dormibacteraeota bacterium]
MVSVVVPTYNRAAVLPFLLDALSRQVYPSSQHEVVVVDNSSTDDTEEVIGRWRSVLPVELRYYRKENRGPAASRNYGAARARGSIVAFTDSDCIPAPDWLARAVRGFAQGARIVCGPVVARQRQGGPGLLAAQLDTIGADRGTYPTANLMVRREAFHAVGGFDESFGLYRWGELIAGEDADLAWRLKRDGAQVAFLNDVVVEHLATRIAFRHLMLRPMRARVLPRLVRTIPELRKTFLWAGFFTSRARVYYYVAAAGLAAALAFRSWVPLLAVLPWVISQSRGTVMSLLGRGKVAKGLAWLLAIAWFETVTTVALLSGSARYQRLVL